MTTLAKLTIAERDRLYDTVKMLMITEEELPDAEEDLFTVLDTVAKSMRRVLCQQDTQQI